MVRHLTSRQTARSGSGDLKSLLADELLLCLSRRAGELPQQHATQARLLVLSIVERSISRGDFRGMRFLTELAGIGEKAEIRREQLRKKKKKASRRSFQTDQEKKLSHHVTFLKLWMYTGLFRPPWMCRPEAEPSMN